MGFINIVCVSSAHLYTPSSHWTKNRMGIWTWGWGGTSLQGQDIEVRAEGGSRLRGWSEIETPPKLTVGGGRGVRGSVARGRPRYVPKRLCKWELV